ncbi:MAG: hypothetical protein RL029_780 [Actinomycetota bacterium]|jgi:hypothetical protein
MDFRNHPLTAEFSFGERGSAISEFVLIATPLFLPALLFFNAMNNTAKEEMNTSMLARQAVRAFVTAPDLMTGHQRVKIILDQYAKLEGTRGVGGTAGTAGSGSLGDLENSGSLTSPTRYEFTYNIKCYAEKCLEPGSLVELELYRKIEPIDKIESSKDRKASAVARSYVDKWRDTP